MSAKLVQWGVFLLCLAAPLEAWGQSADMTPTETCKVLETTYTAAIGSTAPAYPIDIRPARRSVELSKLVPAYKAHMGLEQREFADLESREGTYKSAGFQPHCSATATPSGKDDWEGHAQFITFTNPVFSTAGDLAVVEVSFQEQGIFGYGMLCMARWANGAWTARCLQSWIS